MRGVTIVLAVIAAVVALCVLDLSCGRGASKDSTIVRVKGELAAGMKEHRTMQADDLALVARDMRVMAKRHLAKGEKRKAEEALKTAEELDRKVEALRGEGDK